jgi:leucyl/phenylalanyl-tRNA--protein transferase
MKKVLKKGSFRISVNKAFPEVIRRCKQKTRPGQTGTWITAEMEKAYIELNRLGYAESVEAWCSKTGALVGGLYGVSIGKAFFGESMFAEVANASKSAFITFVQILKKGGCPIIDCQMETEHLKSLGGEYLPRKDFLRLVRKAARKND